MAIVWGLWFAFLIRYPSKWAATIDAIHLRLARYGLSVEQMKGAEKGLTLRLIVGTTVIVILLCLAITLLHPDALSIFLQAPITAKVLELRMYKRGAPF